MLLVYINTDQLGRNKELLTIVSIVHTYEFVSRSVYKLIRTGTHAYSAHCSVLIR